MATFYNALRALFASEDRSTGFGPSLCRITQLKQRYLVSFL